MLLLFPLLLFPRSSLLLSLLPVTTILLFLFSRSSLLLSFFPPLSILLFLFPDSPLLLSFLPPVLSIFLRCFFFLFSDFPFLLCLSSLLVLPYSSLLARFPLLFTSILPFFLLPNSPLLLCLLPPLPPC